ncbi:MAG TPA: hypothetical protein PKW57_08310, partial [Anaerolineaceae bacterium]|nr:hypothetical protein [Anaerolineaceae bacterium]
GQRIAWQDADEGFPQGGFYVGLCGLWRLPGAGCQQKERQNDNAEAIPAYRPYDFRNGTRTSPVDWIVG